MKKLYRIFTAVMAVLTLIAFTSCKKNNSSDDADYDEYNDFDDDSIVQVDNSNGYTADMVNKSGFYIEHATVDSFIFDYDQPQSKNMQKIMDVNCTTLNYQFGTFSFEERNGTQVLTFVNLNSNFVNDIYGIKMGDNLLDTAEKIYPGSKKIIEDEFSKANKEQPEYTTFYGELNEENFVAPYGFFRIIKNAVSEDSVVYRLEYAVSSETPRIDNRIYFTFDSDKKLNNILINASNVF